MTRDIDADVAAAVESDDLWPVGLVELEFGSGTVRFWTGRGSIVTPDGDTYTGTGTLGRIGAIEETAELKAVPAELELSSIPQGVLDIAKGESWQGRAARIKFGVLDDARQWVGEPIDIFGGRMDQMRLTEGGDESKIGLTAESDLIDMERTRARRYTPEDQQAEYPGDKGFDAVAALQEQSIHWGRG